MSLDILTHHRYNNNGSWVLFSIRYNSKAFPLLNPESFSLQASTALHAVRTAAPSVHLQSVGLVHVTIGNRIAFIGGDSWGGAKVFVPSFQWSRMASTGAPLPVSMDLEFEEAITHFIVSAFGTGDAGFISNWLNVVAKGKRMAQSRSRRFYRE